MSMGYSYLCSDVRHHHYSFTVIGSMHRSNRARGLAQGGRRRRESHAGCARRGEGNRRWHFGARKDRRQAHVFEVECCGARNKTGVVVLKCGK